MGKPRDGKEVKTTIGIRIEPSIRLEIIKVYGSVSNFFNEKVKKDKKLKGGK